MYSKNYSINTGKTIRLKRIFDNSGKAVIFAPVHNMTSPKPYGGQTDVSDAVEKAVAGGANAMIMSKGFLRLSADKWNGGLEYLITFYIRCLKPGSHKTGCSIYC